MLVDVAFHTKRRSWPERARVWENQLFGFSLRSWQDFRMVKLERNFFVFLPPACLASPYRIGEVLIDRFSSPSPKISAVSFSGQQNGSATGAFVSSRSEPISLATLDRDCFIIPVRSLERFLPAGVPVSQLAKP
jgi:hypothetical protein